MQYDDWFVASRILDNNSAKPTNQLLKSLFLALFCLNVKVNVFSFCQIDVWNMMWS